MFSSRPTQWILSTTFLVSSLALVGCQSIQARPNSDSSQTNPAAILQPGKNQSQDYLMTGIQKAFTEDYVGAIEAYDLAIQLTTSNSEVYYNRGVAYFSIGQTDNAIKDFNRAIELTPTMAEAYGNRGTIRLLMNDRQDALSDFQTAAQLFDAQEDHTSANMMRGLIEQNKTQPL
ncbi:tetratricopeptide repeat protein [Acaryochloris marina]|uniref:tetratricopeptide repeat protein n=1 Tax=Acaryochloris marina TaxID=155978 RepID=UPI001BAEBA75|nr:tetratricopeptide repeat protein [Acaryochloris marina]QUY45647.1 tetratricopeptide repeat protein [Acaryochloris marina S15]